MSIPDAQLETWSHQGAMTTSKDTYAAIKRALEDRNTLYANRNFEVFLQGSYGNDTNIYTESDVDIVICYTGAFYHDLQHLEIEQQNAFKAHFGDGAYSYDTFKTEVQAALVDAYGKSVQYPGKAFKIAANGSRRSTDVLVAFRHRRYVEFKSGDSQRYHEGISFFTSAGKRIDNFPGYHSRNLTTKHQATGNRFKPAIRIFKNIRSKLIENRALEKGDAPSYFIEGLLYNVPNEVFTGSLNKTVFGILTWLHQTTDRTNFLCANECYYLLRDADAVCWPKANGIKFINATIQFWNNWAELPKLRFI